MDVEFGDCEFGPPEREENRWFLWLWKYQRHDLKKYLSKTTIELLIQREKEWYAGKKNPATRKRWKAQGLYDKRDYVKEYTYGLMWHLEEEQVLKRALFFHDFELLQKELEERKKSNSDS